MTSLLYVIPAAEEFASLSLLSASFLRLVALSSLQAATKIRQSRAGVIHCIGWEVIQTCSRVEHTSLHPSPQSSCHLSPLLQHPCHVRLSAQKPPDDRKNLPNTSHGSSGPHLACCCHHRCLHRRPNPHQASSSLSMAALQLSLRLHAISDIGIAARCSAAIRCTTKNCKRRRREQYSGAS